MLTEALEAGDRGGADEETKAALTAKLPPAPKQGKKDKKKAAAPAPAPAAPAPARPRPRPPGRRAARQGLPAPPRKQPCGRRGSSSQQHQQLPSPTRTLRALDDLMSAILTGSVSPPTKPEAAAGAAAPKKAAPAPARAGPRARAGARPPRRPRADKGGNGPDGQKG